MARLAEPTAPPRPALYVFGWPSHVGGADTRLVNTLPLWSEIADVTVVPNEPCRLSEQAWRDWLASRGAVARPWSELPARLTGFGLAMSNQRFFVDRLAHQAKERGLHVIWSSEMMWHHAGELEAVRDAVVDTVLYTSETNRAALEPGYLALGRMPAAVVVENYVDPDAFPFRTRAAGKAFTIGRLSRADPLKYPEDFPTFYELLGLRRPRYRVMAWDARLAHKYRWHPFGPEWELLAANAQPAAEFLASLDAFVYPLGHDFRESWGRAVVEAMLTGLPVVVPAGRHHFTTYLRNGETGFLCRDHADFAAACAGLEAEPDLRAKIGHAAHRFARDVLCDRAAHLRRWREVLGA